MARKKGNPKEFSLPAFSVSFRPDVTESELDKIRKKTIRRNAPPGEDLREIKRILKSVKGQEVGVQEFIALVAPSVGDQAAVLREVMNDDLNTFRKLAKKVYETATKDNGDVLLNEQVDLKQYYQEKKQMLDVRLMKIVNEIYELAPAFNFDRYLAEKEKYLDELFPIPHEIRMEPSEVDMMRRQQAYHRLHWLHSEGDRLNEENNQLKKRLAQLRRMHADERQAAIEKARQVEEDRAALEAAETQKKDTLDYLNQSLEKSIIEKEENLRFESDRNVLRPKSKSSLTSTGATKKRRKKIKQPAWAEVAAADIDSKAIAETAAAEMSGVLDADAAASAQPQRPPSPFHYSPPRTPPGGGAAGPSRQATSPFHYSPPRTPPGGNGGGGAMGPASQQQQQPPQSQGYGGRRGRPPTDQWGGFY